MSRPIIGVLTASLLLLAAGGVLARFHRVAQLPNGSVNGCSNCHVNPNGGGTRNAFGLAVQAGLIGNDVDWGPTLAALDSDGDGFTNGTELQDPNGTWVSGAQGNSALVSKPGDASSVPAAQNSAPVLAAIGGKTVAEGVLLSFTLTATDSDGDNVSFTVSGAPSGASLSGATFSWTPSFSQSGTYNLTFTADDGQGNTDSETITITVNDLNQAPQLGAIGGKTVAEGFLLSFALTATDSDGDNMSFTVSGAPSGSSLSGATFNWAPSFSQSGTYNLTFTADDGQGNTDSENITITVQDVNRSPQLGAIGDKTVVEGVLLSFTLTATDSDGDNVSFTVSGAPSGATLSGATFNWTPSLSQSGTYDVTFTADDGQGDTDSETITITVNDLNQPPELSAIGDQTVGEAETLSFVLSGTDPDGEEVSFSAEDLPTRASLTGATFDWTPGFDQSGAYSVTFTATDERDGADSETITITVEDRTPPLGPVSIDFDLLPGDQQRRLTGPAAVGQIHACELHIVDAPEIDHWRVDVEFDPGQLRYFDGSFRAGDFLAAIDATASGEDGLVSLSVSAEDPSSGNGELGVLSFEILEEFGGSTDLTVVGIELSREGEIVDSQIVLSAATIVSGPIEGVLTGDFDGNGRVDFGDFFLFVDSFRDPAPLFDLNRDAVLDLDDFFLFSDNFGEEAAAQ